MSEHICSLESQTNLYNMIWPMICKSIGAFGYIEPISVFVLIMNNNIW